jgi:hypothetical protein
MAGAGARNAARTPATRPRRRRRTQPTLPPARARPARAVAGCVARGFRPARGCPRGRRTHAASHARWSFRVRAAVRARWRIGPCRRHRDGDLRPRLAATVWRAAAGIPGVDTRLVAGPGRLPRCILAAGTLATGPSNNRDALGRARLRAMPSVTPVSIEEHRAQARSYSSGCRADTFRQPCAVSRRGRRQACMPDRWSPATPEAKAR